MCFFFLEKTEKRHQKEKVGTNSEIWKTEDIKKEKKKRDK